MSVFTQVGCNICLRSHGFTLSLNQAYMHHVTQTRPALSVEPVALVNKD